MYVWSSLVVIYCLEIYKNDSTEHILCRNIICLLFFYICHDEVCYLETTLSPSCADHKGEYCPSPKGFILGGYL